MGSNAAAKVDVVPMNPKEQKDHASRVQVLDKRLESAEALIAEVDARLSGLARAAIAGDEEEARQRQAAIDAAMAETMALLEVLRLHVASLRAWRARSWRGRWAWLLRGQ